MPKVPSNLDLTQWLLFKFLVEASAGFCKNIAGQHIRRGVEGLIGGEAARAVFIVGLVHCLCKVGHKISRSSKKTIPFLQFYVHFFVLQYICEPFTFDAELGLGFSILSSIFFHDIGSVSE